MEHPKAKGITVSDERGGFSDIVRAILAEDAEKDHAEFAPLAETLKSRSDRQTLRNVWSFVRGNVRYKEDGNTEKVKSPARLLSDGVGDCKSMALLSGALVKNLGYPYFYRVVRYDKNNPEQGHIYLVAKANGKNYVIDPVHADFDREEKYWKKMETRIQRLRGINRGVQPGPIPENVNTATGGGAGLNVSACCILALVLFLIINEKN